MERVRIHALQYISSSLHLKCISVGCNFSCQRIKCYIPTADCHWARREQKNHSCCTQGGWCRSWLKDKIHRNKEQWVSTFLFGVFLGAGFHSHLKFCLSWHPISLVLFTQIQDLGQAHLERLSKRIIQPFRCSNPNSSSHSLLSSAVKRKKQKAMGMVWV